MHKIVHVPVESSDNVANSGPCYTNTYTMSVSWYSTFGNVVSFKKKLLEMLLITATWSNLTFDVWWQEHVGSFNCSFYFNYGNYRNLFPIWALGELRRRLLAKENWTAEHDIWLHCSNWVTLFSITSTAPLCNRGCCKNEHRRTTPI
jgi:hypothetical protein